MNSIIVFNYFLADDFSQSTGTHSWIGNWQIWQHKLTDNINVLYESDEIDDFP